MVEFAAFLFICIVIFNFFGGMASQIGWEGVGIVVLC